MTIFFCHLLRWSRRYNFMVENVTIIFGFKLPQFQQCKIDPFKSSRNHLFKFSSVHPCDRTDIKVCSQVCTKASTSYTCSCRNDLYKLANDKKTCIKGKGRVKIYGVPRPGPLTEEQDSFPKKLGGRRLFSEKNSGTKAFFN